MESVVVEVRRDNPGSAIWDSQDKDNETDIR